MLIIMLNYKLKSFLNVNAQFGKEAFFRISNLVVCSWLYGTHHFDN